jgi:phage tail-like protein
MARSSKQDPIEKFRFIVTAFEGVPNLATKGISLLGGEAIGVSSALLGTEVDPSIIGRSGFNEVTLPKVNIKEMSYRENIQGNSPIKVPGLATYEPVVLKRGVTKSQSLWNWYQAVNNDSASLSKYTDALAGFGALPFQDPNYRREILISAMDRTGSYTKHWLLYNAWPIGYKGANDFDAKASEVAIEELTITYETFLEVISDTLEGAIKAAAAQAAVSAQKAAKSAAIGGLSGFVNKLF